MPNKPDMRFRRLREKGNRDFGMACEVIDAARICHVGFTMDDQPYVVPMALGRDGDHLLLHGSTISRLMKNLSGGVPCCVTVTHLDGLVLARSAFHSSMNYRSVMVFGKAVAITDPEEKVRGLNILTEHLIPGRLAEVRESTRKELNATTLLTLPINQFTVKISDSPPDDPVADVKTPIWAGVIPFTLQVGKAEPAPDMDPSIPLPSYLSRRRFK